MPKTIAVHNTPSGRYHGFTCPKCGAHEFSSFIWHPALGDAYEGGTFVGVCQGYQHNPNNICKYRWNREDPAAEAEAIYHMISEEWVANFLEEPFLPPEVQPQSKSDDQQGNNNG